MAALEKEHLRNSTKVPVTTPSGPLFARELRRRRSRPTLQWHLDEMAVMIGGKQFWLWRAVDIEGEVLDLLVQRRRNTTAATKLMRKLLKKQGFTPEILMTERRREFKTQRFKSPGSAQRFLTVHAAVHNTFNTQR